MFSRRNRAYGDSGIDGEGADDVAGLDEIDGQEGADDVRDGILTVGYGWQALSHSNVAKEAH